ncbi:MAG TPA: hypothetical protein VMB53_03825 [Gaiellaceae bacterium]|nr:hypothetical protein [Gaiellaceae bacterium]
MTELNTSVRFPDGIVERFALFEAPEVGRNINARDACWRITRVRMPWGLDQQGDDVYDIDVEAAPPASSPTG